MMAADEADRTTVADVRATLRNLVLAIARHEDALETLKKRNLRK